MAVSVWCYWVGSKVIVHPSRNQKWICEIHCELWTEAKSSWESSWSNSDNQFSINSHDNLLLLIAIHTKSHKLPFNFCWNVCVIQNLPPKPFILLTTIKHLSTNSFYPSDSAPVLISDNFLSFFTPSLLYCWHKYHLATHTLSVTAVQSV